MKPALKLLFIAVLALGSESWHPSAIAAKPDLASQQGIFQAIEAILASPQIHTELSHGQIVELFTRASTNPVARLGSVQNYDPQGVIGFCFGRALCSKLIARQMGLAESSIQNLFIIGDLRSGDKPEWRFHVTTVVKGPGGQPYAIDPLFSHALTVDEWVRRVRGTWDKSNQAKLYLTPFRAMMPDNRDFYLPEAENGQKVIQLNFDPGSKIGFQKLDFDHHEVFAVDQKTMERYFLHLDQASETRFDLTSLTINVISADGQKKNSFSYEGYFDDLARSLGTVRAPSPQAEALCASGMGALDEVPGGL